MKNLGHGVWKSEKKSHSSTRAKRATFTFWVDKSSFKTPKIVFTLCHKMKNREQYFKKQRKCIHFCKHDAMEFRNLKRQYKIMYQSLLMIRYPRRRPPFFCLIVLYKVSICIFAQTWFCNSLKGSWSYWKIQLEFST